MGFVDAQIDCVRRSWTDMKCKYSVHLSQDQWHSPEVRYAWARLIAGCSDTEMLGNCPELIDHLRCVHDPSQFHLALVRDPLGSIVGLVPLRVTRSGLRFEISQHILAEDRLRAVKILGSVPLLPADPDLYDLLFATLDEVFAGLPGHCHAQRPGG